jgi:tetratricopeptide (TPR) repeat protein
MACAAVFYMMSASLGIAAAKKTEPVTPLVAEPVTVSAIPAAAHSAFDEAMRALQAGQTDQASLSLQELAVKYPALSSPLINLGLMEQKQNRHEAAVVYFTRALERDAKSAFTNTHLGISYRQLGKLKEAEAAYRAAININASYALAHLNLGILYDLYLQQPTQAVQEYETYQGLLATPDAKVATWLKEVKGRLGNVATKTDKVGVQP